MRYFVFLLLVSSASCRPRDDNDCSNDRQAKAITKGDMKINSLTATQHKHLNKEELFNDKDRLDKDTKDRRVNHDTDSKETDSTWISKLNTPTSTGNNNMKRHLLKDNHLIEDKSTTGKGETSIHGKKGDEKEEHEYVTKGGRKENGKKQKDNNGKHDGEGNNKNELNKNKEQLHENNSKLRNHQSIDTNDHAKHNHQNNKKGEKDRKALKRKPEDAEIIDFIRWCDEIIGKNTKSHKPHIDRPRKPKTTGQSGQPGQTSELKEQTQSGQSEHMRQLEQSIQQGQSNQLRQSGQSGQQKQSVSQSVQSGQSGQSGSSISSTTTGSSVGSKKSPGISGTQGKASQSGQKELSHHQIPLINNLPLDLLLRLLDNVSKQYTPNQRHNAYEDAHAQSYRNLRSTQTQPVRNTEHAVNGGSAQNVGPQMFGTPYVYLPQNFQYVPNTYYIPSSEIHFQNGQIFKGEPYNEKSLPYNLNTGYEKIVKDHVQNVQREIEHVLNV